MDENINFDVLPSERAQVQQSDGINFDKLPSDRAAKTTLSNVAEEKSSAFMAGVEGFNRQFARMAEGSLQLFAQATGMSSLEQAVGEQHRRQEASAERVYQEHPYAYGAGAITGMVGMGATAGGIGSVAAKAALPTLAKAPYVSSALQAASKHPLSSAIVKGSAIGAGFGALDYSETGGERAAKTAFGGIIGGAIPAGIAAAKGVGRMVTSSGSDSINPIRELLRPNTAAKENIASKIKSKVFGKQIDEVLSPEEIAKVRGSTQAAQKIGGKLTPGQALDNEALLAAEGRLKATTFTEGLLSRSLQKNERLVKEGVEESLDRLSPKGLEALSLQGRKTELYDKLRTLHVSPASLKKLKSNEYINDQLEKMSKNIRSDVKNLSNENAAKLTAVKQKIDDTLRFDRTGRATKPITTNERSTMLRARNEIDDVLVKEFPDAYPAAKKLGQRFAIKTYYDDLLKKKEIKSVGDLHNALFKNPGSRDQFLDDLRKIADSPSEAKELMSRAKSIMDFAKAIKDSPLSKIDKAAPLGAEQVTYMGTTEGLYQRAIHEISGRRYNEAVMKLILDKNWSDEIADVLQKEASRAAKKEDVANLIYRAAKEGTKGLGILGATRAVTEANRPY